MFKLKSTLINSTPVIEYMEGNAGETFKSGEALVLSKGKLTKCSGANAPAFVCVGDVAGNSQGTSLVPVFRVTEHYIFSVPSVEGIDGLTIGDTVTLSDDGMGITAETDGGVAEIVALCGETVSVKF